jgi:branched-chain amino acid transport system ATP-binding protein
MNHFGNQLSGGEQQMLSVVRALMTNPKLLVMDEATEGLAPLVRKEIWRGLTVIKNYGQSILIIDKNLDELMKIADRHYIMEKGRVVWSGDTAQLSADDQLTSHYLGV